MRKLSVCTITLFIFVTGLNAVGADTAPSQQEALPMTLAEAVTLALRHNRTVESAYLNRLVEKFDLTIAQDKFHPDLYLSSSVSQESINGEQSSVGKAGAEALLKVPTGGELSLSWSQSVYNSNNYQWFDNFGRDLILSFRQPLLKGGGLDVNRASQVLAQRQENKNIISLKMTLMNTVTQVVYAYRNFLLAQRKLEINRLSFERSKRLLEVNRILIEEGRLAKVEITQTEADLANQELNFLASKNSLDTNRLNLLKLLDIDRHTLIEPTESIQVEPVDLHVETLLPIVLKNNPDYLQALLSHKNAQTNLLSAKNNKLWELDLEGRYNITGNSTSFAELEDENLGQGDYSIGMALKIPFGDDSLQRAALNAEVEYRKATIALKELKENIAIDVQDAARDITMKWKQVELSKKALELSEKQLDIELEKFKAKLSDNFTIVALQNHLIEAENNENTTKIYYLNALTALDLLLGTTLEHWGIQLETARNPATSASASSEKPVLSP